MFVLENGATLSNVRAPLPNTREISNPVYRLSSAPIKLRVFTARELGNALHSHSEFEPSLTIISTIINVWWQDVCEDAM